MSRTLVTQAMIWLALSSSRLMADASTIDPACVAKVSTLGPAAWKAAKNQIHDLEVTVRQRSETRSSSNAASNDVNLKVWKICWKATSKRRIIEVDHVSRNVFGLHVANDEYKFVVGKLEENGKPKYQIGGASASKSIEDFALLDSAEEDAFIDVLGVSYQIIGFELLDVMTSPDFQLDVARFIGTGSVDERSAHLEWKCVNGSGPWKRTGARFWVELGPKSSWLIERCGVKLSTGKEFGQNVEYRPFGEGVFQDLVTKNFKYPHSSLVDTLEFEPPHPCRRPDAEFYLPYYGLPETIVDVTRINPWIKTGAILLSAVGTLLSIYFYHLSRQGSVKAS